MLKKEKFTKTALNRSEFMENCRICRDRGTVSMIDMLLKYSHVFACKCSKGQNFKRIYSNNAVWNGQKNQTIEDKSGIRNFELHYSVLLQLAEQAATTKPVYRG